MNQYTIPTPTQPDTATAALADARNAARLGQHEAVLHHAGLACSLAERLSDVRLQAESRSLLSNSQFSLGRFGAALSQGGIALALWRQIGDVRQECQQLRVLSHALTDNDLTEPALELAQAAFERAERAGETKQALFAATLLGSLHARLGDVDTAETVLLQVLSRARESSDDELVTHVLNALTAALLEALRAHRAAEDPSAPASSAVLPRLRRHAYSLLQRCETEANAFRRAILRSNTGAALAACGDSDRAETLLRASLAQCNGDAFRMVACKAHLRLAEVLLQRDAFDAAEQELSAVEQLLEIEAQAAAAADVVELRAELARRRGDAELARCLGLRAAQARDERARRAAALHATWTAEALELPARIDAMPHILSA